MSLDSLVNSIPVMLIVWAVLTACFVAILTYRGQLTRYEQERLFLSNVHSDGRRQQTEIVHRLKEIQPYVRILGIATTLVTVVIVTIWTMDAWRVLHT